MPFLAFLLSYLEEYANKMQSGYRQLAAHLVGMTRDDIKMLFDKVSTARKGRLLSCVL